jgi:hypothetical protein
MLDEYHRIVVANSGDEHSLGIPGRRRHYDFKTVYVGKPRLQGLAVLKGLPPSSPGDRPDDHRDAHMPARAIAVSGNHVDELIEPEQQEIDPHVNMHRSHAVYCRPETKPRHRIFCERSTEAAMGAEFLDEACAIENPLASPTSTRKRRRGVAGTRRIVH